MTRALDLMPALIIGAAILALAHGALEAVIDARQTLAEYNVEGR